MNLSPRSRAHPPHSRQPLSTLACKNRCLPCNRSSSLLLAGVAPNRRNHGARGLLISACVSLRHMARIRPATVVAESLASSGRKSPVNAVLQNLKQCICHCRLAKCQFRPQSAKVQEQICVFHDAFLRVLAVDAVFNTRGTRDVSRQHLRQLSGIASESLAHSHDKICYGFWVYSCCVCSMDRTVLLLAVYVRTDAIERDVSRVARQNTHFLLRNDRS